MKFECSRQGTRWHYTISLPSTAKIGDNKHVLLATVDIKAMGDMYALKSTVQNPSDIEIQTITNDGGVSTKKYPISNKVKYQIVSIMSANKTSRDDLAESGTH